MPEPEPRHSFKEKLFSAEEIVAAFYEAGLDRAPDGEGLKGWCESLCRTRDVAVVLRSFATTAEFRQKSRVRGWNPKPLARKFYFVHIPKTGGTSVHSFLQSSVDETALFPFCFIRDLLRSTENLEQYSYFSGHFQGMLDLALSQETRKAVLLRDPVSRTLSHFLHHQRDSTARHHLLFKGVAIEEMAEMPEARRIFGNFQSKYLHSLSGTKGPLVLPLWEEEEDFQPKDKGQLLKSARSILQEMEVVGLCEQHQDFCRRLARAWDLKAAHFIFDANKAPNALHESVPPEALRKIAEWNDVDIELYQETERQLSPGTRS